MLAFLRPLYAQGGTPCPLAPRGCRNCFENDSTPGPTHNPAVTGQLEAKHVETGTHHREQQGLARTKWPSAERELMPRPGIALQARKAIRTLFSFKENMDPCSS